jgi:hypothetical protein
MWPKKLYFEWEHYSGNCEDCGWYDGVCLVVKDEVGNVLLKEHGDSHLSGGEIMYEASAIPFLLKEAGYGSNWDVLYSDDDFVQGLKVINHDDPTRAPIVLSEWETISTNVELTLASLGHEIISSVKNEVDDSDD